MKPTKEELNVLRVYAQLTHQEDKYVWLRKDEKGTYIEYAFKEGVPHDKGVFLGISPYSPMQ